MSYRGRKRRYDDRKTRLSKSLSYLLRHGAMKEGLSIRSDGYVPLAEILNHKKFKGVTVQEIQEIVDTCEKKRYKMIKEGDVLLIRANQGHSMKIEVQLEEITDPKDVPVCIHGTYYKSWPLIQKTGLSRMSRTHIHFAMGELGDKEVISGMRSSCEIFIYVNIELAMKDGYKFYKSENNVILCAGKGKRGIIPPYYFEKVIDAKTRKELPFEKLKLENEIE